METTAMPPGQIGVIVLAVAILLRELITGVLRLRNMGLKRSGDLDPSEWEARIRKVTVLALDPYMQQQATTQLMLAKTLDRMERNQEEMAKAVTEIATRQEMRWNGDDRRHGGRT